MTSKKLTILSIETSCDESALSIMKASGTLEKPQVTLLSNDVASQIELHREYGGVFPMMAKREHAKNLTPLLIQTLTEAKFLKKLKKEIHIDEKLKSKLLASIQKDAELFKNLFELLPTIKKPNIDLIAVTTGPGLEPALWVGINFAKMLSLYWDIPVVPVNHMEGHVVSSMMLPKKDTPFGKQKIKIPTFPLLSLLVSGGHTELVLAKKFGKYQVIGSTRDDAAGEAFDKVARMLNLPYPGGPEISKIAKNSKGNPAVVFPRPMMHSNDFEFSFSGLKTSVLYFIRDLTTKLTPSLKADIAKEFQDSVIQVLVHKTLKASKKYAIKTLLVGGGVAANHQLRKDLTDTFKKELPLVEVCFPRPDLSTDNSIMIGLAGFLHIAQGKKPIKNPLNMKAKVNLQL